MRRDMSMLRRRTCYSEYGQFLFILGDVELGYGFDIESQELAVSC